MWCIWSAAKNNGNIRMKASRLRDQSPSLSALINIIMMNTGFMSVSTHSGFTSDDKLFQNAHQIMLACNFIKLINYFRKQEHLKCDIVMASRKHAFSALNKIWCILLGKL